MFAANMSADARRSLVSAAAGSETKPMGRKPSVLQRFSLSFFSSQSTSQSSPAILEEAKEGYKRDSVFGRVLRGSISYGAQRQARGSAVSKLTETFEGGLQPRQALASSAESGRSHGRTLAALPWRPPRSF